MGLSDKLPEDFEGREKFARFEDEAALARAYAELEKKIGGMLPAPTSEESKLELFKRLGAPDSADGYQLPPNVDPSAVDGFKEFAAKARLTPEQFARLAEEMHTKKAEEYQKQTHARGVESERVRAEYGEGFDAAQARVVKALQQLGPEAAQKYDINDPDTFRLLERLGGASQPTTAGVAPVGGHTPASSFDPIVVAEEARKILNSEAYRDRFHPEHQTAKDEYGRRVMKLMEKEFEGAYDPRLMPRTTPW